MDHLIAVPRFLINHIQWWTIIQNLVQGLKWKLTLPTRVLTTDASLRGWGGHLGNKKVQGRWKRHQLFLHINNLQLQAVFNALKSFLPQVRGQSVLIQTDNTTVLHYIHKMGGTKSEDLCILTWDLINWCKSYTIDLRATHLPGIDNVLADHLSTKILPYHEWELAEQVARKLFHYWPAPEIDLFATFENKELSTFCSLKTHRRAQSKMLSICIGQAGMCTLSLLSHLSSRCSGKWRRSK